jgi:hypothetical protein
MASHKTQQSNRKQRLAKLCLYATAYTHTTEHRLLTREQGSQQALTNTTLGEGGEGWQRFPPPTHRLHPPLTPTSYIHPTDRRRL